MKKLFPPMTTNLTVPQVIGTVVCWVVVFFVAPFFLIPFAWGGVWGSLEGSSWVEIVYHVAKTAAVVMFLKECFADAFFFLQTSPKTCLGHAVLAFVLMVAAVLVQMAPMVLMGMPVGYLLNAFPLVEMSATCTPGYLAHINPIFGTLCLTLVTPVSVCGLFYIVGFAPACSKKTWLGYLCVTVVTLLPALIGIMWQVDVTLAMDMYLLQLPVHLIACWSYQKTDNIWTPVFALGLLNLLTSLANVFLIA